MLTNWLGLNQHTELQNFAKFLQLPKVARQPATGMLKEDSFPRNLSKIIEIALLLPPEKIARIYKFASSSASRYVILF